MYSCPCCQPTQTTINHYLARHYSARLGSARLSGEMLFYTSNKFCLLAVCPKPKSLELFLDLRAQTHEKRTTKTSREGTQMSCDKLTRGKIIFGYTPRVVLPPQQPVSNATMEQVKRWGDDGCNLGTLKKSSDFSSV